MAPTLSRRDLLHPPVVSFTALGSPHGFALVLSIWKPWGRTRWARRRART